MIILNTFPVSRQLPKKGGERVMVKPVLYSFIGRKKENYLNIKDMAPVSPPDISGKLTH